MQFFKTRVGQATAAVAVLVVLVLAVVLLTGGDDGSDIDAAADTTEARVNRWLGRQGVQGGAPVYTFDESDTNCLSDGSFSDDGRLTCYFEIKQVGLGGNSCRIKVTADTRASRLVLNSGEITEAKVWSRSECIDRAPDFADY